MKAHLLGDSSINSAVTDVAYNHVPQGPRGAYIFFQQSGAVDDIALGDSAGRPTRTRFAVECWSDDPYDAVTLKGLVQARLHKYRGAFGDSTVQGIFAEDVDDQYVPNGNGADDGLHSASLFAEVVP